MLEVLEAVQAVKPLLWRDKHADVWRMGLFVDVQNV